MKLLSTCIVLLFLTFRASAQATIPDPGFGSNGVVITAQSGKSGIIHSMALQSNGRIIAGGESYDDSLVRHVFLARYLTNGALDTSFGLQGKVNMALGWHDAISAVIVQADGKITVAGNQTIRMANPSGITIVSKPFLIRFLPNGMPDNTFGNNGIHHLGILDSYPSKQIASIVQLPDGRLVAGGSVFAGAAYMTLVCLNTDGSYDRNFAVNGSALYVAEPGEDAILFDLAAQPDGKLLLAGSSGTASVTGPPDTRMALVRVTPDGRLDTSFSNDGMFALRASANASYDIANRVSVLANGKILAAGGAAGQLAMIRLQANGVPDPSFGQNGLVVNSSRPAASELAVQADGRLLVAGLQNGTSPSITDISLSRFTANGAADPSFGNAGILVIDQSDKDRANALMIQADRKILLAGHSQDALSGKVSFTLWRVTDTNLTTGVGQPGLYEPRLYPNPTTGSLVLSLQQAPATPLDIRVLDLQGRVVYRDVVRRQHNPVSLSGLRSGTYMLQLSSASGTQVFKIAKE